MSEEQKKISFGFAKINKKAVLSQQKKEDNNIQFIDCLEENSIKLLNGVEKEKELPVIPLRNGNILRDNMIEALKARKEARATVEGEKIVVKDENFKTLEETQLLTLDELAAKEILEDLKRVKDSEETHETLTIPQAESVKVSEKESTLEDYESMPVNQFGLAVLRGMGWAPDKGVGKNAQIVKPTNPVVRPKGMGLGADKVIPTPKTVSKEELIMKKDASLKIISGLHKGLYGKIEGFDELPGRLMVRLTLQNTVISISENLVVLVTSEDYNRNSKILNLKEYNNFVDIKKPDNTRAIEKKKTADSNRKIEEYSSEEDKKTKKEYKNVENYRSKHNRSYKSDKKYNKHKYSRDVSSSSDSDRQIRSKHDSRIHEGNKYRSSKYKKDVSSSSDSDRQIRSKHDSRKHEGNKYRSSKYEKDLSSSSDSDRQIRSKHDRRKNEGSKYRSIKDKKDKRIEIISSDSDSQKTKNKSKHKHSSRHKSRSRSRSVSRRKKKKKSRCISRS